jgi:hypothetical protein
MGACSEENEPDGVLQPYGNCCALVEILKFLFNRQNFPDNHGMMKI